MANVIITSAFCVHTNPSRTIKYNVLSGSYRRHEGTLHIVKKIRRHPIFNNVTHDGDIAMLQILPPIDLELPNIDKITVYNLLEPVPTNTLVTTSGWGSITIQR